MARAPPRQPAKWCGKGSYPPCWRSASRVIPTRFPDSSMLFVALVSRPAVKLRGMKKTMTIAQDPMVAPLLALNENPAYLRKINCYGFALGVTLNEMERAGVHFGPHPGLPVAPVRRKCPGERT